MVMKAVRSRSFTPAHPRYSPSNSWQIVPIRIIFAASEHHCSATFPAMYFLLSLTTPISRLLIIMLFFSVSDNYGRVVLIDG